ncbi:MAG TPA: ATP-dependent zinc metalloprotease FtsH [Pseudobdellovibrionaceae bacterium]|nr:ATP-dependent zinc metalloprotease FtsH [Pseudobdellovibrionaceae bacterium]
MKSGHKAWALWVFLLVIPLILFQMHHASKLGAIPGFTYERFVQALKDGKIASVTFKRSSGMIVGEVKPEFEQEFKGKQFQVAGNTEDSGFELVRGFGITPNYDHEESSGLMAQLLINWLPILLFVVMFMFIMRQIQVGGGKAMSFGKSRHKILNENKIKVTFADVAGVEEAKDDLVEIVQFLKDPKKFTKLGGRIPKGVLLVGPPGTGKTLLARAVAGEAGVPFFTISGSDFVEMFVGVGASRVRDLFEQGKRNAPCLIFIDEIDAVGRHRGAGMGGGHDEREQTLNQMLVEMDGFESNDGVILIAATNRPDVLDPALLRPGRFDRRVVVNKPDIAGRRKIIEVHTKKTPIASDVDVDKIARGTPGFAGADLENLVNEAALNAARTGKSKLTMEDFEYARDKVMMGAERRSMVISEDEKKNTAYHEAGHALVSKQLPKTDPIHKVTIIPRGMALGLTMHLPEKDQLSFSKLQAESMITVLFGGRAAEELVFTDYTTGAGNDIERATQLARRMVCEWGMSRLGPLAYEKREGPVFLGLQQGASRDYSEAKAEEIDKEVYSIVHTSYEKAKQILTEKRDALDRMAQALLELETIDGAEVDRLIAGSTVEDIKRDRGDKDRGLQAELDQAQKEMDAKEALEREAAEKAAREAASQGLKPAPVG